MRSSPSIPPLTQPDREFAHQAEAALQVLRDSGAEGQSIYGGPLNKALGPLRLWPALGVICGSPHADGRYCRAGLGFIAIDQQSARIVSGNKRRPKKQRLGGVFDLASETPDHQIRRFEGWIEDAYEGKGKVTPTGERQGQATGFPTRRRWDCPTCGATHTLLNTTILTRYLEAITRNDREIVVS